MPGTLEVQQWKPDPRAISVHRAEDSAGVGPTILSVVHATAPFLARLESVRDAGDPDANIETYLAGVRAAALRYLGQVNEAATLNLPLVLTEASEAMQPLPFSWLPIGPPSAAPGFTTNWLLRYSQEDLVAPDDDDHAPGEAPHPPGDPSPVERTLILSAAEWLGEHVLGSGTGLRVTINVRALDDEHDELRLTGMSASLPVGIFEAGASKIRELDGGEAEVLWSELLRIHAEKVPALFDFVDHPAPNLRGVRLGTFGEGKWQVGFRGMGVGSSPGRSSAQTEVYEYDCVADFLVDEASGFKVTEVLPLRTISKVELSAAMAESPGSARVFPQDPVSQPPLQGHTTVERRPTRPEGQLDLYRKWCRIVAGENDPLRVPGWLEVMRSQFVRVDLPPPGIKTVRLPGTSAPPVRSDDFSAVNALNTPRTLFKRLLRYGFWPPSYFRYARLPFKVFYRSGQRPGPGKDGQTVNAWVKVEGWDDDRTGPFPPGPTPRLEMHLACGDLRVRNREVWDGRHRCAAQPLGIGADERWMWHELGHVVLMAATGELELRFAHSPGDALAAIVADPKSHLANGERAWRGATFPWVFIPRRHDRSVERGWSWSGTMHRPLRQLPDVLRCRRKGYRSEQILSTSLFRMYRCIGGDAQEWASQPPDGEDRGVPDREVRCVASHYSVYLILRALKGLGAAPNAANQVEQLVDALIEADAATEVLVLVDPCDEGVSSVHVRTGGCAHKAVRWAFEAQGLYAPPNEHRNDPGDPPPVDVYIEDRRCTVDSLGTESIDYGPGSYVPVPLERPVADGSGLEPSWFAKPDAVAVEVQGTVARATVTVSNRGTDPQGANVEVEVWLREWDDHADLPDWLDGSWNRVAISCGGQIVPRDTPVTFGPFEFDVQPAMRYLVLAQASCAADPANSEVSTGLPCSRRRTPLVDLVANDNNLGLRILEP